MFRQLSLITLITVVLSFTFNSNASELDDMVLMKQVLSDLHPGYIRYRSPEEADKDFQELAKIVKSRPGTLKVYAEIQRYLSAMHCDHTLAELPKQFREQKQQRMSPFHLRAFGNRLFISHGIAPLQRGDELLAVNDVPMSEIINKLTPYVAYDGYTSHVVVDKIAENSDVLGSYFEVLLAPVVLGLNAYPESLNITVRQKNNDKVSYTLNTISLKEWQKLSGKPYRQNFKDAVSVDYYDSTAVLTVDTFVNYRQPVDAKQKFEKIFKELRERNVKHLIVDLRDNGGGSDDAQFALLTHLTQSPLKINTKAWIKGNKHKLWQDKLTTWDKSIFNIDYAQLKTHPEGYELPVAVMGMNYQTSVPAEFYFKGDITLLTSKANSSASAAALGILAQQAHISTVGQPTGGNLGGTTASIITFLKLPESGITVRVPLIRNVYNIESVNDGYGLTPDIIVKPEINDWLAGKDTILDYALNKMPLAQ